MINWIITGALAAVLMAEVVDAWALRQLARRCLGIHAKSSAEIRLVRWYAEGFDHSVSITSWLRASCIALTLIAVLCGAHPLVIVASLVLAVAAHGERYFSESLRRRFMQVERRAVPREPGQRQTRPRQSMSNSVSV